MKKRRKKRQNKSKLIITLLLIAIVVIVGSLFVTQTILEQNEAKKIENQEKAIKEHYNKFVKTNKDAKIYTYNDNLYTESGSISKDEVITLVEKEITYEDKYFKISDLDETYYIKYEDVTPVETEVEADNRYTKYIPFNESIVTSDTVNFYDEENNLVYNLNKSLTLPILIKYGDYYGVAYNDRLLKIKKEDIKEVIQNKNTEETPTASIAVLNYHFFYDETKESERKDCNQYICISKTSFSKHLDYIKNNNIFTPTLEEYEMWYDNKIRLPKSVVITTDDGWRMTIGNELLDEYKLNGNVFLITSWWDVEVIENKYEYVNYYSHGDDLHTQGACPGGQGGAIKCRDREILLKDLLISKRKVEGKTMFCYPFYEYNDYSISILKEAGFTMAFAGGNKRSTKNSNRYAIPRYVIGNSTSVDDIKKYIG